MRLAILGDTSGLQNRCSSLGCGQGSVQTSQAKTNWEITFLKIFFKNSLCAVRSCWKRKTTSPHGCHKAGSTRSTSTLSHLNTKMQLFLSSSTHHTSDFSIHLILGTHLELKGKKTRSAQTGEETLILLKLTHETYNSIFFPYFHPVFYIVGVWIGSF